ncbi:MAG: recombinase family protein [Pseudomonadales bacterium]|nr:recombinase family protein [Pseudomonadales bacterium]
MAIHYMQIARLYLRVSTDEQDLARQADIEHSARQAGYYIAGIYREKANTRSWTAR